MKLKEIKLVLDWSLQKLDKDRGSKITRPEEYNKSYNDYKLVKDLYDQMCQEFINQIKEKKENEI
jgi:ABC-type transporter lipoprotein component MlaA